MAPIPAPNRAATAQVLIRRPACVSRSRGSDPRAWARRPAPGLGDCPHICSPGLFTLLAVPLSRDRAGRVLGLRGRWRLFRHEAGRAAGPPPWTYVLLFVLSQLIGHWSVSTFSAVVVWLSNGILVAALLQLHRRPAIAVIAACLAINLFSNSVRGDPGVFLWFNALLNLGLAMLVAVLTRRFCGAALDMRRPVRLMQFAAICAVSVAVAAVAGSLVATLVFRPSFAVWLFMVQSFFIVELTGLLLVTPVLLLFARGHRFAGTAPARWPESAALMALVFAVSTLVFWQGDYPILFLTFPPMLLIALRLSPGMTAAALFGLAFVSGVATLTGHGPIHLARLADIPSLETIPPMLRKLGIFNLYLLIMVATVLPLSTIMSERRRLEARLRARTVAAQEARRFAEHAADARSRFLAMMSHELRTPLNGVAGFADLLAARPGLDLEAVRHARRIRESSDGLLVLVEDILDFASGDTELAPEALDLAAVAREATAPSRVSADARDIELTIDDRLPPHARFICDRRALRQALQPLIANAIKFTVEGGVCVRLDRAGDGVVIRVSDTGCGIAPDHHIELFQAFSQADASTSRLHSGVGLGLALVARHVRRLGGRVELDSRPGEGSTFTLHLPLERAPDAPVETVVEDDVEAAAASPDVVPAASPAPPPRVLVVDDHPVNREVARIMLQAFGCEVVEARDGYEALQAASDEVFDLLLIDVRMPGMDGLETTRRVRSLPDGRGDVPIVAITADAMPGDVVRCHAAGMNAHLAKPVSQAALFAVVSRALSGDLPLADALADAPAASAA
ncbi:MAG: response regulator [Alphaproteobacteria bacterium]|nr:response regulator [Alphaproteobacteria bacterium]